MVDGAHRDLPLCLLSFAGLAAWLMSSGMRAPLFMTGRSSGCSSFLFCLASASAESALNIDGLVHGNSFFAGGCAFFEISSTRFVLRSRKEVGMVHSTHRDLRLCLLSFGVVVCGPRCLADDEWNAGFALLDGQILWLQQLSVLLGVCL